MAVTSEWSMHQNMHQIFVPRRELDARISNFQIGNCRYNGPMQGQDIALLLKLAIQDGPRPQSKDLAESLFISPSEVSKALKRCVEADLLYVAGPEKRVNRSALMEFLSHGLKYVFPAQKGFNGPRCSNRRVGRTAQITFCGGSRASCGLFGAVIVAN